jgi:ribose transport system substrate-binding protein
MRFTKHILIPAVAPVIAVLLAACSSSSSSSATGSASSGPAAATGSASSGQAASTAEPASGGVAAVQATVAKDEAIPADIPDFGALSKAPPQGLKVAFLNCNQPACANIATGISSAAKVQGWDLTTITYNSATPGQAVQNALDAGNKYIVMSAVQLSTITPQVQEAKAKGVPLFVVASNPGDLPAGSGNDLYGVVEGGDFARLEGTMIADYVIADSNGKANMVDVVDPLFPTLAATDAAEKAEFQKNCPGCTFDSLSVSADQIGAGKVPSLLVSYLQSHPSADYAGLVISDFFPGIPSALQTAGLSKKVKIVGVTAGQDEISSVAQGTSAAWVETPNYYPEWIVAQWIAQLAEGQAISPQSLEEGNVDDAYLVGNPAQANATLKLLVNGGWPGPVGYDTKFKSLWLLG